MEGASLSEQLLDLSRRDHISIVEEMFEELQNPEIISSLINNSKDPLGNTALHLCTQYGSYNVLDLLLYQEGVEVDPQNRRDRETPLHLAVKYSYEDMETSKCLVEVLIEAGADPRIKNKYGEKPLDLVRGTDKESEKLRDILEEAEYAGMVAVDEVGDNSGEGNLAGEGKLEDSASDSDDFDFGEAGGESPEHSLDSGAPSLPENGPPSLPGSAPPPIPK